MELKPHIIYGSIIAVLLGVIIFKSQQSQFKQSITTEVNVATVEKKVIQKTKNNNIKTKTVTETRKADGEVTKTTVEQTDDSKEIISLDNGKKTSNSTETSNEVSKSTNIKSSYLLGANTPVNAAPTLNTTDVVIGARLGNTPFWVVVQNPATTISLSTVRVGLMWEF